MFTVKIVDSEKGTPPGKLAGAEIHFQPDLANGTFLRALATSLRVLTVTEPIITPETRKQFASSADRCEEIARHLDDDNPLDGLKLIGFAVWERRGGGGRNVTFPARQYAVNGERRSFALLRPISDVRSQEFIRDAILRAYADYEQTQAIAT